MDEDAIGPILFIVLVIVLIVVISTVAIPSRSKKTESVVDTTTQVADTVNIHVSSPPVKVNVNADTAKADTVKSKGLPSNADLIFYTIPTNKLLEYAELSTADQKDSSDAYSDINNQKRWGWLRTLFNRSFEPYIQDGITYVWCIHEFNSNTIVIYNGFPFDISEEQLLTMYIKYRDSQ
jgi:hypothetical protein